MHLNCIGNSCKKTIHRHSTIYAGSHSLMTGLQMDEHIARIALNQGATPQVKSYLTDALGSVIATAKADQSLEVGYAFSPYGQTQKVGVENQLVGSENSSQYTGRENDNNGLYFYRARYYDPVLKRFISEDPIGLAGGANVYQYVNGNPITNSDPTGLYSWGDVRDAFAQYCTGVHSKTFISSIDSLSWSSGTMVKIGNEIKKITGGTCSKGVIPVNNLIVSGQTTGADAYIVGQHNLSVSGRITTDCDCNWTFNGYFESSTGEDLYNMNAADREWKAETLTFIARNGCYLASDTFNTYITGSKSISFSGRTGGIPSTCCQ